MKAIINIGLLSNEFDKSLVFPKGIPVSYAKQFFTGDYLTPARIVSSEVRQSSTEPTLILELSVFDFERFPVFIQDLAGTLEQDAIAVYFPEHGKGALIHSQKPKNHWGDFNKEYFLTPEPSNMEEPVSA